MVNFHYQNNCEYPHISSKHTVPQYIGYLTVCLSQACHHALFEDARASNFPDLAL